jgi:uncharacterized protein involved in oxidation of intracellular sulfur
MADAVAGARRDQKTPEGFYNLEQLLAAGGRVLLCGTCMDARGLKQLDTLKGAERSTMDALAAEMRSADKVLAF